MAFTGLLLSAWTALHMAGNLLVFLGPDTLNRYAATLQGNPLVWVMRVGLLGLVAWHMSQAWATWRLSRRAADTRQRRPRYRASTLSARSMRAGGIALAAFTVYHVLHIFGVAHPHYVSGDVYNNVVQGFRQPLVTAVYLMATVAFCAHIRHGLFSAGRSLGLSTRTGRTLSRFSLHAAIAIGVGFSAPCIAAVTGMLR